MRADIPSELEDGRQVNLQHGFPVVVWKLVGRVTPLDTAAVEQDVYSVTVFEDGGDKGADGVLRGEVCGVDCGFAAERLDGVFDG